MPDSHHCVSDSCFEAAAGLLLQGEAFLQGVSNSEYVRSVPEVFNASIGGHYRHVLDHFQLVLDARPGGVLRYHQRERDREIESSVSRALEQTRKLIRGFRELEPEPNSSSLEVYDTLSADPEAPPQSCTSSIERETLYAVHHAVHHFALIRVMGRPMGLQFPEGFGVAASTRRHQHAVEDAERAGS